MSDLKVVQSNGKFAITHDDKVLLSAYTDKSGRASWFVNEDFPINAVWPNIHYTLVHELKRLGLDSPKQHLNDAGITADKAPRYIKTRITKIFNKEVLKSLDDALPRAGVTLKVYNSVVKHADVIKHLNAIDHNNVVRVLVARASYGNLRSGEAAITAVKGPLTKPEWEMFLNLPKKVVLAHSLTVLRYTCKFITESKDKGALDRLDDVLKYLANFEERKRWGVQLNEGVYECLAKLTVGRIIDGYGSTVAMYHEPNMIDYLYANQTTKAQLERIDYLGLRRRCEEYHQNLQVAGRIDQRYPRDVFWNPYVEEEKVLNDLIIVPLSNSVDLGEEGTVMQHCVGGYWSRCQSGSSRIFSVRNLDAERLATLELSPSSTGWRFNQVHGPRNRRVSPKIRETCEEYVEFFNEKIKEKSNAEPLLET